MVPGVHLSPHPNGISIGSAVFTQLTAERPYTLQLAATFPPQSWIMDQASAWTPIGGMVPWANQSAHPKRRHDWFSCFCEAHGRYWPTDTETDRHTYDVYYICAMDRIYS